MKTSLPPETSWGQALDLMRQGKFPMDLAGMNPAGWLQIGTFLSKANLLQDETAALLGLTADAVPDDAFETLLGRPIPESRWDREAPLELNDTFAQLQYARGWVGRLVYRITKKQVDRGMDSGKPDLDALFRYNMPVRAIAKMTGGAVTIEMAEALLEIFNGRFFGGIGHLVSAFVRKEKEKRAVAEALGKGK